MDEGPLWAQRPLRIPAEAYVDTVLASAERLTVEMLGDVYPGILSGQIRPRPQVGEANVVPMRRPEDGLIDWSQPARRVFDFVRAQSRPYPGAFTSDGVRIWRASIGPWISGPPGTVVDAAGRAGIVCGDGIALIVEESEPPVA
jgi:methionyl-tRNA formyltransferase